MSVHLYFTQAECFLVLHLINTAFFLPQTEAILSYLSKCVAHFSSMYSYLCQI